MKKRVFIIHGWGAGPKDNWFQWAKWELENYYFEVMIPQMPETNFPKLEDWLKKLHEIVGEVDEKTYFIGHSLGTITILKYLESLEADKRIGGVVLVSGFMENFGTPKELENFMLNEIDMGKVRNICDKFIIFQSDDDPLVPIEQAIKLRNALDGELNLIHGAGHLNSGTIEGEFPELINEIIKISQ